METQPKILILDDDPIITDLLADILHQEGYNVMASNSSKDVLFLARQFLPDLLVLDIMMPEVDGYDVCDFFKRDPDLRFTRIVILSARDSKESRVRCYKAGADVYLPKPFEMDELREVVHTHIRSKLSLDQYLSDLQKQAVVDRTANCYARKYIERRIREELKRMERYKRPMALLMVDLDNFGNINSRYGYHFGNEILKDVAQVLKGDLRECDLVGRYTADSFLVVLPETAKSGAKAAQSRMHDIITSMVFLKKKRFKLQATIASLIVEEPMKPEDVFSALEAKAKAAQEAKLGKKEG